MKLTHLKRVFITALLFFISLCPVIAAKVEVPPTLTLGATTYKVTGKNRREHTYEYSAPGGAKSGFIWLIFLPAEKDVGAGLAKAFQLTYAAMRNGGTLQTFDQSGALIAFTPGGPVPPDNLYTECTSSYDKNADSHCLTYIKKMEEGVLTIILFKPIAIKATLETAQARAGYIEQRNALRELSPTFGFVK